MQNHIAVGMLALALGAVPVAAQTAQSSQTAPPSQTVKNPPEKPKKVWTNDDLSELRGGVTSASAEVPPAEGGAQAEAQAPAAAGKEKPLPPEKDPKVYRAKLDALRKQLADVDAKIKDIQDALNNPFNGTNKMKLDQQAPNFPPQDQQPGYQKNRPSDALYGNQTVKPQDQLTVYQQKREQLQLQIDDLEAQASQNGIEPGDIR
ncbi:MAG TPA: hypothetical protein VJX29_09490 [Candidatus Acidoferrales bacterium]|nr:hypothetical protein [Candidatus Acidoferrales bacterium]